jgi:hypothetical protein
VVRNLVVKIEPAEPPVGKVQFDLLAQLPLETYAVAVAHNQHSDHEFGVDRGTADVAVEGFKLAAKVSQHLGHDRIEPAQQMPFRNARFEVEQIEKLALIARLPPHHGPPPMQRISESAESLFGELHKPFFQQHRPRADLRRIEISRCNKALT